MTEKFDLERRAAELFPEPSFRQPWRESALQLARELAKAIAAECTFECKATKIARSFARPRSREEELEACVRLVVEHGPYPRDHEHLKRLQRALDEAEKVRP